MKRVRLLIALTAALLPCIVLGQESLLSEQESYYGVLEADGEAESGFLNYRTLSDNTWTVDEAAGPWSDENLGTTHRSGPVSWRVYGPELFTAYNSAYPHGMNDGALWQGVGLNASATAGVRAEAAGFEITVKPVVVWEENRDFDIMASAGGNEYGYFWSAGVDLPQRFGDSSILGFDWGDTELRYSWKNATIGFGTQAAWIGPGRINAIMLSDNAPTFPKADIGLRKTSTPIGEIEGRAFWGYLTESDYFDEDSTNDHNSLLGLSLSYRPIFFRELTLGLHRTLLGKWEDAAADDALTLLIPMFSSESGDDEKDQRASITADLLFPSAGFECWLEWARNDYTGNFWKVLNYPFHSQGYTVGLRKTFDLSSCGGMKAELLGETTCLESSRDYEFLWPYYFYGHGIVTQGYTNGGQILGAGIQGGGNSQYLGFSLYQGKGRITAYGMRMNRDDDYSYFLHMWQGASEKRDDEFRLSSEYTLGTDILVNATRNLRLGFGAAYCLVINPLHETDGSNITNLRFTAAAAYELE